MMNNDSAKRFFQIIADEAILGIVAFRFPEFDCIYSNRRAREVLELNAFPSDHRLTLHELFTNKSSRGSIRPFTEKLISHEGLLQDILIRKANGHRFIANIEIKHLELGAGNEVLLLMFQDITFQKKLQREVRAKQVEIKNAFEELLLQHQQLKELDIAKDRFIALTTHELRTPLSALVATAEVLKLKLYDNEEQLQEFIGTIHEQGQHLMELVNDVLDYAKIQAGKMEFYVEKLHLMPLLRKQVEGFTQMAEQEEITMSIEACDTDDLCYFDQLRLREVVSNVLNNAIKYNRSKGRVHIRLESDAERVRIAIEDTGRGIPADKTSHVFNEFETIGNLARHHKGTGLGMPISKRLIQGMGGNISLTSREGEGSTFFIDVPKTKVLPEEFYRPRPDLTDEAA